ncbi:pullulanase [Bacillus canaveralius]|uniref:Pullulanase n=1 Tax=Bacillus canaveralius TaxID=1403243 RepID=A0A2N5GIW2_9BACI|nr:DUF6509 family protein [Bacillus canaveralius]PLR80994.1 pullulanase [Bacillus canaveralius]PLR99030.1 pullulanase [Bacillus canaveralius]RSK51768.1 pullulanase [Bacillus canaveralius]
MNITEYTVEKIGDPFGILTGDRYDFFLRVEVPEDDELYMEAGLSLKVLFIVTEESEKIANYHFIDDATEKILEFELEEDEEEMVAAFCKEHYKEAL